MYVEDCKLFAAVVSCQTAQSVSIPFWMAFPDGCATIERTIVKGRRGRPPARIKLGSFVSRLFSIQNTIGHFWDWSGSGKAGSQAPLCG